MQEKKQTLLDKQSRVLKTLGVYMGVVLLIFAIFIPFLETKLNEEQVSVMGKGEVSPFPVSGNQSPVETPAPSPEVAALVDNSPEPVLPVSAPETAASPKSDNNPVPKTAEPGVQSSESRLPNSPSTVANVDLKKMIWPLKGKVLKSYGMVYSPTFSDYRFHQGIDIQADMGSEVMAVLPGKVLGVETNQLEETKVIVDHGAGWQGIYAQLEESYVKAGDSVKKGQAIGAVGKPGLSEVLEGTHLHFSFLRDGQGVNPLDYLPQ